MKFLRNQREQELQRLNEEIDRKAPKSEQRKKEEQRRDKIQSSQQQLSDRIDALERLQSTYAQLRNQTATVTLNIKYRDAENKQVITVPVRSKEAMGQPL